MTMDHSKFGSSSFVLLILLVLLQGWSRYSLAPVADHISDTWGQMSLALSIADMKAIGTLASNEVDRPVTVAVTSVVYRLIGDSPVGYALWGAVGFSLLLSMFFKSDILYFKNNL